MDQSSSDVIERAVSKLRELVRTYPKEMDIFLRSLKVKCDSMQGIPQGKTWYNSNQLPVMHVCKTIWHRPK